MAKQFYSKRVAALFALIYAAMLIAPTQAFPWVEIPDFSVRPDPWDKQVLPPQPRPGYYRFLGKCIDTLTKPCGLEIFDYVYGKGKVQRHCCRNLKAMGLLCAKSLALTLGQIPKFKRDAALISVKSDEAYAKCLLPGA